MTVDNGSAIEYPEVEGYSIPPSIVVLDPLNLRRSCIAKRLQDWSRSEGLKINSVASVNPGSRPESVQNCRLFIISIGGKSINDPDVRENIKSAKILFPDTPILIVSDLSDQSEIHEAFRLGVKGFIPTSIDPKIALRACTFIIGGGSYFPPSALLEVHQGSGVQGKLQNGGAAASSATDPVVVQPQLSANGLAKALTERQMQVANLLKDGLSNKMIARELGMTEATVKVHVRQIMRKLGVHNRTQVAISVTSISGGRSVSGTIIDQ